MTPTEARAILAKVCAIIDTPDDSPATVRQIASIVSEACPDCRETEHYAGRVGWPGKDQGPDWSGPDAAFWMHDQLRCQGGE